MKPRNKFQKYVASLQRSLKPATEKQIKWGVEHCFSASGHYTNNQAGCLECGHTWKQKSKLLVNILACSCPNCGRKLEMTKSFKRKVEQLAYYTIYAKVKGFQVVRTFCITRHCLLGSAPRVVCSEVMQHWIDSKGNWAFFSMLVNTMGHYYDQWIRTSELELRDYNSHGAILRSSLIPAAIYPKGGILPEIRRNGFKGEFHDTAPPMFFKQLLTDSRLETLLKANQAPMLRYYMNRGAASVDKYWNSIKICIRNSYIINSASTWTDYLDLLASFNKDLLSSHYVCPMDLQKSHDALVKKKRARQERIRLNEMREKIETAQAEYQKLKGAFFGIAFSDGHITVKVLETVAEFMLEGDRLRHCVFANEYFKKPDSLVLSARIDDQPVETIELSLSTLKILQARGEGNRPTEFHSKIIDLVDRNLNTIGTRLISTQS